MKVELAAKKTLALYSGTSHPALAEEVADALDVQLGEPNIRRFANGEIHCRFDESVRGADVARVQGGALLSVHSYYDQVELMTQLGLMPKA